MSAPAKKKADLKVVLTGAADVGKTCLVVRYTEDSFNKDTESTIGASFFLKQWGPYNIAIWDTAGEERFSGLSNFYCRDAGAAIMAYDITEHSSFEVLRTRFLPLIPEDNCLKVIVGTKLDLITDDTQRAVSRQEARQFACEINERFLTNRRDGVNIPVFETSSMTGEGVAEVFEYIFTQCLSSISSEYKIKRRPDTVDITATTKEDNQTPAKSKKKCC